jgi:hypothetical protein
MKRVQENGTWSLFCPNEAPGLADCWVEAFEKLYVLYESEVCNTTREVYVIYVWMLSFLCCIFYWLDNTPIPNRNIVFLGCVQ